MDYNKDWDVLGVGETDVDIFLKVDHIPDRDEKVAGELLGEYPGGIVANFCCAASMLGNRTSIFAQVARDRYGEMSVSDLEAYGVDTGLIQVRDEGSTYFCIVLLDSSGEKALTVVETDCMFPDPAELDPDTFSRSRSVYLMAGNLSLATWAAVQARSRDVLVTLDLETSDAERGLPALRELLTSTDIVFPNETALSVLTGEDPETAARQLLELGAEIVVVKKGAEGCLILTEEDLWSVPSFRPPAMVDSTGAGDCFNAAFVTGYLRGWIPERCGKFASAAAALSLREVGARGAIPTYEEVERFMTSPSVGETSEQRSVE